MMKRILVYIFMAVAALSANAQTNVTGLGSNFENKTNKTDTTKVNTSQIDPAPYQWCIDEQFGDVIKMPIDTILYNFQNAHLTEGINGHYNHIGNIGSPRINRIFFERKDMSQYPFNDVYDNIITPVGNFRFTNSKKPYTNLTYYKSGSTNQGEERFSSYFSTNVNKDFAFGFKFDYTYGRGYYAYDNTAHLNSAFFASYLGQRYQAHFLWDYYYMKTAENGGITDDRYITEPLTMSGGTRTYSSDEIPVNFGSAYNAWNRSKVDNIIFTHRYILGFKRVMRKNKDGSTTIISRDSLSTMGLLGKLGINAHNDSIKTATPDKKELEKMTMPGNGKGPAPKPGEMPNPQGPNKPQGPEAPTAEKPKKDPNIIEEYVPVTSFIHTLRIQTSKRKYYNKAEVDSLYSNTYLNSKSISLDSLQYLSVKNTLGIEMMEGFNKWAKAGITAFVSHEYRRSTMMDSIRTLSGDTVAGKSIYSEQEVFGGLRINKDLGNTLHYHATGQLGLLGKALGQFKISGDADLNFHLLGDTIALIARGEVSNTLPSMFMRHYHGNHYWWDNDNFNKIFQTKLEGEFTSKRLGTKLKINVENITNYTYLGSTGIAMQESGNLQVIGAQLTQNFKMGILHLDNEITYQKSSNNIVLPLPDFSLYHNLYIETRLAKKVLHIQLGADVRYFTKYYAPAYSPELGLYHTQDTADGVKLGGFPIVDLYLDFHVKRTRFYLMMYNVMHGKGNSMEFYVPHYPINPSIFKMGISINLFD